MTDATGPGVSAPEPASLSDPSQFAFKRLARIARAGAGTQAAVVATACDDGRVSACALAAIGCPTPDRDELAALLAAVRRGTSHLATDILADPLLAGLRMAGGEHAMRFALGVPVLDGDNGVAGALWVFDVDAPADTARVTAHLNDVAALVAEKLTPNSGEQRARRAETRLIEAVEALSDGFVYFDADDRLVLCNQRYRDFHHRSAHALVPGASFPDILRAGLAYGQYPEAKGREEAWLAERLDFHRKEAGEAEQELPDGRWLRIVEKVTASGGRVGLRVDITRLKLQQRALEAAHAALERRNEYLSREVAERNAKIAAEERARRAEAQLSEAISAMTNGFVYFDADDRLVHCSDQSCEIYNEISEYLVPGTTYTEIISRGVERGLFSDARGRVEEFVAERWTARRKGPFIAERQFPQGMTVQLIEQAVPSGGWVGLQIDITDLKRHQSELERARSVLARQNEILEKQVQERTATIAEQARDLEVALAEEREITRAQQRFVAMVSHEFRTPLSIIDAAAGRVQRRARRNDAPWAEEYVKVIQAAIKRLVTLIESLLGAAQRAAGRIELKPADCNLAQLVREICESERSIAPDRLFDISCHCEAVIRADHGLVYQVITNLVSNAVKYSGPGSTVRVTVDADETEAHVTISDEGVGIPAGEISKVFTRFFRASTSSGIAGTGIGLSLSREFARLHGGDLSLTSEVGVGSTFTLTLPVLGPPLDDPGDDADHLPPPGNDPGEAHADPPPRLH